MVAILLGAGSVVLGQEGGIVTQDKWAQALVRTLGWEKAGIPQTGATQEDYFSLLSSSQRLEVNGKAFQRKYGEAPESYYYYMNVPKSGRYFLKGTVYGGPQFWTIDGESSVLVEAQGKWGPADVGTFILSRGVHLVRVTVPKGSSLSSFSFDSSCPTAIEPAEGWRALEPLTYAGKAATVVKTLDLESRLPQEGAYPFSQGGGGYAYTYTLNSSRSVTLTMAAKYPGPSRGIVHINGCGKIPYVAAPRTSAAAVQGQEWQEIFTKTFLPGQHSVELVVDMGPPPSAVTFIKRSAGPEDYIKILEDLKMEEGAAKEFVVMQKARINLQKIQIAQGIERIKESSYLPGEPGPAEKLPSEKIAVPYREPISPLFPPAL